jgi:hypothetical protein
MKELKEKLMAELIDYGHGELTHSSLDVIDKLAHALKNVLKIEEYCKSDPVDYEKSGSEVVDALKAVIDKIENM